MKVTFVLAGGFDLSGGDRVIATYAEKLLERGHTVLAVAAIQRENTLRQKVGGWARRLNILPSRPAPNHFQRTNVPHRRLKTSRQIIASDLPDADVVIATWWETAEWVSRLPQSKGQKMHFVQHYEAFEYCPKDRVDAVLRMPIHKVTISKWLLEVLKCFGNTETDLIPNSVDTQQFTADSRSRNRRPRVGMLYSSIPWKGCDIALQAVAEARLQFPDIELVTFGSHDSVARESLPLPPNSSFEYRPDQGKIPKIYASCDAWICGSYAEGFHLPPLEAMACRTPVVSTAVGGPIDIIDNGINGFVVPVGDVGALGRSLVALLRLSDAAWERMSSAAHATAHAYSWDDAADRFEETLERLVKSSHVASFIETRTV